MHMQMSIRVVSLAAALAFVTTWVACSGSSSSQAPTTVVLGSADGAAGGSNVAAADETGSGAGLPAGRPEGPPEEALTACDHKAESEACSFTSPRGEAVDGTCRARRDDPGQRVCFPNDGPGRGRPGGPPEELLAACEQKATGDSCTFTSPRGDAISGTCAEGPGGIPGLLCHPEGWTGEGGPRGPHGPNGGDGAPLAACETSAEGAQCSFEAPSGTVAGTCRVGRDGHSLVCAPADWPGPGR